MFTCRLSTTTQLVDGGPHSIYLHTIGIRPLFIGCAFSYNDCSLSLWYVVYSYSIPKEVVCLLKKICRVFSQDTLSLFSHQWKLVRSADTWAVSAAFLLNMCGKALII